MDVIKLKRLNADKQIIVQGARDTDIVMAVFRVEKEVHQYH